MLESPVFDPEKEKSAEKVDRTPDLMIFSHTLSQLSYLGTYLYRQAHHYIPKIGLEQTQQDFIVSIPFLDTIFVT